MANSSLTDILGSIKCKYVDHSDFYTYKVKEAKDDVEDAEWVLNCTIKITAVIRKDDVDPEGGFMASVNFPHQGSFETYIPHGAWNSVDQFRTAVRRYSKGLPPLLCLFTQADFQRYADDRMRTFHSNHPDGIPVKKRVMVLGKQTDSNTFVFGPSLVFAEKDGRVASVKLEETEYAWIPGFLTELNIDDSVSVDHKLLFQQAAETFPADSVYAFALTLGAFYMGVHRDRVLAKFHRCPTVICVGDTNCGKTYAASRSANYFASNAASSLEHKSLTPAAAREISSQQNMPTIVHDPTVAGDIGTLIEESYEGKAVTTQKDRLIPRASLILTCNKDRLAQLREHMRVLSRCVLLMFLAQFREQSATALVKKGGKPTCSRKMVELLLQMTDDDLEEIAGFIDSLFGDVLANLKKYGLSESVERIAFNISMVYGFTVKALSLVDTYDYLDMLQLRAFVVQAQTQFAATWQTVSETPTGSKRRYKEPPVALSPAKRFRALEDQPSVDKILKGILDGLGVEEVKSMVKVTTHHMQRYVALNEPRVFAALKGRQMSVEFMANCREVAREVPGFLPSIEVRYGSNKARAMLIPVAEVSNTIIRRLSNDQDEAGKAEDQNEEQTAGTVLAELPAPVPLNAPDANTTEPAAEDSSDSQPRSLRVLSDKAAATAKEQFPSPPSSVTGNESTNATRTMEGTDDRATVTSSASSLGAGTCTGHRFDPDISREVLNGGQPLKCHHCGKDFPVSGQLLNCSSCKNSFHRNCQAVVTGTYLGDNARKWRCRTCKPKAPVTKSGKLPSRK